MVFHNNYKLYTGIPQGAIYINISVEFTQIERNNEIWKNCIAFYKNMWYNNRKYLFLRRGGTKTFFIFFNPPPGMELIMGFPVVSPAILKELIEQLKPMQPNEFCDVIVSSAAVEYAPRLSQIEVVRALMKEENVLAYNMSNLPDEQSQQFIDQSHTIVEMYPNARYYWQMRTLFMSVLQNRSVNFENRFLLLNYSVKTIQGMIDKGQANLVPRFIEDFTKPDVDYKPVLEYFKAVRPNPGYSLADGISLLKSLTKPNAAYKDVLSGIYKNLGVSGPETIRMADMKKYLEMRKQFSELVSGEKARYMENVMISYVWTYSIPLANPEFNFWDHFVFFCSLYNAIKIMITCYAADGNEENFAKAICAFDTALRASDSKLMNKVIYAIRNAGQSNNGDLAILTLS